MGEIADRARELAALRVAVLRDCTYIWVAHTRIAEHLGLTINEIAGVRRGQAAFGGHDAAVLQIVDDVVAKCPPNAATQLALGSEDVLGLTIATGFYDILATIMQGAAAEPGVAPIPGLETPTGASNGVLAQAA
jgi:AhpD family alkylhydroperoxidase